MTDEPAQGPQAAAPRTPWPSLMARTYFAMRKRRSGTTTPNYDVLKLHKAVCALRGWQPNLVRFYTGVPTREENPMWAGYWSARSIAMTRAGVRVTTRTLRYHNEQVEQVDGTVKQVTVAHEKGIDVRLALDAVSCARSRQYDVAVLYSQDRDLAELAADQGRYISLGCAYPSGPNASSNRGIDGTEWIPMTQEFYDTCLDPGDYRPRSFRA